MVKVRCNNVNWFYLKMDLWERSRTVLFISVHVSSLYEASNIERNDVTISRGADEVISRGAKVSLGRSILRFRKFVSRETTNLTVACCLHDQGQ